MVLRREMNCEGEGGPWAEKGGNHIHSRGIQARGPISTQPLTSHVIPQKLDGPISVRFFPRELSGFDKPCLARLQECMESL